MENNGSIEDVKIKTAPKQKEDTVENKKKVKFIQNPLPGPKPHVKKEMNYDYDVPPEKMFFDNDKPSKNFYDI